MINKVNFTLYQEKNFYVLQKENEITIIISKYTGIQNNPEIIYDGKDHAIFYKNKEITIILDFINPIIRKPLLNAKQIKIIETEEKEGKITLVSEYYAKLKPVKKLPTDMNIITPEKIIKDQKKGDEKHRLLKK